MHEDRRGAAFLAHRRAWHQHAAGGGRCSALVPQERELHAHVGKDAGIQLVERRAHLDGGLLAVGGRDHGTHLAGNLPVRVRVEHRGDRLPCLDACNIRLVHVDLDLERRHVDDGRDARAREATAGRDRRDHLAALRILRDDDAAEGRPHRAVVEILLRDLHAGLGGGDLLPGEHDARPQTVDRHARLIAGLLGDQPPLPQFLDASGLALGVLEVDAQVAHGRRGGVLVRVRRGQARPRIGVVELGEDLAGLDAHALVHEDLVHPRGDLGGDSGPLTRRDVAAGVQQGRPAALVRPHGRYFNLGDRLAQKRVEPSGDQQQRHEPRAEQHPAAVRRNAARARVDLEPREIGASHRFRHLRLPSAWRRSLQVIASRGGRPARAAGGEAKIGGPSEPAGLGGGVGAHPEVRASDVRIS